MLTPQNKLSPEYHSVAGLLNEGWSGAYGDLAVAIGRSPRFGQAVGQIVKSYARRNPAWPHDRVYSKQTGRPAYEA